MISVVVPVYNIGAYLEDALESVIAQNIGFLENIELILVDDGSTDTSGAICAAYAEKYPRNITHITQKNFGVSKARNVGMQYAHGEYIHFFDGDDQLSKNFYTEAITFLRAHPNEVDFVAAKLMFFDGIIDSHPLNYKFHTTRVLDLNDEPSSPILHIVSCVFRRDAIKDMQFDEKLSIAEDVKLLSDMLLSKRAYGVVSSSVYYYRKRTDSSSAIGGKERNRDFYEAVPKHVYEAMLDKWSEAGSAMEYTVLYDLSYRLKQKTQSFLNPKEEQAYKQVIRSIATSCSDEAIVTNRFLTAQQKHYVLSAKHGDKLARYFKTKDGVTYFKDYTFYNHTTAAAHLDFLTKQADDTYKVEGYVKGFVGLPGVSYSAVVAGKETKLRFVPRFQREQSFLGNVYDTGGAFEAIVTIPVESSLSFHVATPGKKITMPLGTGPFTKFGALKLTYRREADRLFKRLPRELRSMPYTKGSHIALELRMLLQIALNWRLSTAKAQLQKLRSRNLAQLSLKAKLFEILKPALFIAEAVVMIPRAFILRTGYYIALGRKKRPIWIISDRGMAAGDNGEALFKYVMSRDDRPADVYFALSKKSKDYARLQQVGPVLHHGSLRHKLLHLLADKIISSQADVETTNPFIRQQDHYVDLFNFDFVFLQHGVIRHNLSSWLNRFDKNISLFVTSAQKEYDSILNNPYYYDRANVLLSGLPRYDYLENRPAKKLILAPTYRKNLAKQKTDKNGVRRYDTDFVHSEYRTFYNSFMNDKRLLVALKKAGMTGEFYLHPAFSSQHRDFDENEQFKIMQYPYDYRTAFSEGELLVSDHSSVVFDFAYLKKPTAYAHFDVGTFFEGHSYDKSNFFSDEEDGFGEVYYDYDSLVLGVIEVIKRGCIMEEKYKKRVDSFFYKVDKKNSQRVYEAILKSTKVYN